MPAKTAQDLKNWNKNNPSQKTYIKYSNDGNTITVYFCDEELAQKWADIVKEKCGYKNIIFSENK